jgi:FSR family fosmidomycin resistance protein-like MFS transporter
VYKLADHRKGLAMSAHLSGGSLGFAAAPVMFAPFIAMMGLPWSPLIMIPGLIALSWTLRQVPEMSRPAAHERSTLATLRPAAVPLALLYFTIVLRTATSYGFMTFAPTLLTRQGLTIGQASTAVSLYLLSSGVGGFFGGPLADRIGPRRVIMWSLIASVPFLWMAPRLSPVGFTAMLAIGGLLLQSTLPISVTFAQSFVSGGAATVSSLMMGFAWGMGSLAVPIIGSAADRVGIETALVGLSVVPLLAAALAYQLPRTGAARLIQP